MIDALLFWVREASIDGYRCDVAGLVPTPFWEQARAALDRIKPVFMLAEWSNPELHKKAFDMTYGWDLYDVMAKIAKGTADASALGTYLDQSNKRFPKDAYRMLFTSNHDKNAWEASDAELYGKSFKAFAVLAATLPGMPLIYSGQESFLDKRLEFFEKDPIDWKAYELAGFYAGLLEMKKNNSALWNGQSGGETEVLPISNNSVFAFRRSNNENAVTVVVNLSNQMQDIAGEKGSTDERIPAWSYRITKQ
jgi:glycosidase